MTIGAIDKERAWVDQQTLQTVRVRVRVRNKVRATLGLLAKRGMLAVEVRQVGWERCVR